MGILFTTSLACAVLSVFSPLVPFLSEMCVVWCVSFDLVCPVVGMRDPPPTRLIFCIILGFERVFNLLLWFEVFFGDIVGCDDADLQPGRLLLLILCYFIYMMYIYDSYYLCVQARRNGTMLSGADKCAHVS